ncbi:protein BRANCHLESS TRICHOME-like [Salvia splendens]|uniref:protein BRANCHLESS TRICHOME-like n=1 Tax=Salvia splendens TaxID=180675 RepID=UPI001C27F80C|nr:protein BRANCHLESS TRICHOME-like [Salvia splendens]
MEEMMTNSTMVMMKNTNTTFSQDQNPKPPMNMNMNMNMISTTPISPTWKLYENPFYTFHQQDHIHNQIHKLHLPISSRKLAASFFDLAFIKPDDSELERARKKMESLNRRLEREVAEERRGREALERACHDLADQVSAHKAEIARLKREMEEERRMLRTAEVIREERVQMKLSEAKNFLEEKLSGIQSNGSSLCRNDHHKAMTENPHIKRGIKGFVEFPKVVRAIGCRSSKHLGSKLECQKAQLKILLKQKGPVKFSAGLITR